MKTVITKIQFSTLNDNEKFIPSSFSVPEVTLAGNIDLCDGFYYGIWDDEL